MMNSGKMVCIRPVLAVASSVLFLAFCASEPQSAGDAPEWANNLERVYPREAYLTGQGAGKSRAEAEAAALAAIARIFSVEVQNSFTERNSFLSEDGVTRASQELTAETFVRSSVQLFSLRYDGSPWRNPRTKEWETVAYIDREEAWKIYEPRLRASTDAFTAALDAADAADDPLSQYSRYRAVLARPAEEARTALAFAQVLHPEKAKAYASAQNALAGVPAKIQAVLDRVVITVRCGNDFENIISGAIIEAFRRGGFKAAGGGDSGTNRAEAAVEEGKETLKLGPYYTPRLTLTVSGEGKTLFTWMVIGSRHGAWDGAVAKRQAWNALASQIKESLLREFNIAMEGGNK
jgi:hypothetical protein